jgi:hypothetical protein
LVHSTLTLRQSPFLFPESEDELKTFDAVAIILLSESEDQSKTLAKILFDSEILAINWLVISTKPTTD